MASEQQQEERQKQQQAASGRCSAHARTAPPSVHWWKASPPLAHLPSLGRAPEALFCPSLNNYIATLSETACTFPAMLTQCSMSMT